ncbi:hypothetical protein [Lentzea sp. NPDC003310]|uniref:hypothetical protein n=1 Tax=Lentzea sp. NPDC003310 TaxID=3154447 RepID=UPI0033BCF3F2
MTDKIPPGFDHERFQREAARRPNAVVAFIGSLLAALQGLPQETARRHRHRP